MKFLFTALLIMVSCTSFSQNENNESALIYYSGNDNPWNSVFNPAKITSPKNHQIGIKASNPYLIKNLGVLGGVFNWKPGKHSLINSAFEITTNAVSTNFSFQIGYGMELDDKWTVGVSPKFKMISQPSIKSNVEYGFNIGSSYSFSEKLTFESILRKSQFDFESSDVFMDIAGHYRFNPKFSISFLTSLSENSIAYYSNFLLNINDQFTFNLGISNSYSPIATGVTIKIKSIYVNLLFKYHTSLGFNPETSLWN